MIVHFLFSALAVFITAYLVPGVTIDSFVTAILFALVLGLLNTFVKPILLLLTLPLNILSLGLFTVVINILILYLASNIVPGLAISSLLSAILFGLVLAIVNSLLPTKHK